MMSSTHRPPSATVFIGNIPYGVTDQILVDIFQEVGPVKSLRLVNDRDTGKAKGYGFCEYYEVQIAESAVLNLNGTEVNGRSLRVDYADEHQAAREKRMDREPPRAMQYPPAPLQPPGSKAVGHQAAQVAAQQMDQLLGGPGASHEQISAIIAGMSPKQLYDLMAQFKLLVQSNLQGTRQFLVNKPHVVKALFQAQIILGMVKPPAPQQAPPAAMPPAAASQPNQPIPQAQYPSAPMGAAAPQQPPHMVNPASQAPAYIPPPPNFNPMQMQLPMGMPPQMAPQGMMPPAPAPQGFNPQQPSYQMPQQGPPGMQQVPPGMQPQQMMHMPPQLGQGPPPPTLQPQQPQPMMLQQQPPPAGLQPPPGMQMPGGTGIPPMGALPPSADMSQAAPGAAGAPAAQLDPKQQALLQQVMQMTDAQLASLPEPSRSQVLQLKERAKGFFGQPQ